MSKVRKDRDNSGKTATEQKDKREVLNMIDWFLDSVIYDLVTWVAIAFCIGLTLIYLFAVSPRNWRGVFWSLIALTICALIMIAVRVDQRFFRNATAKAGRAEPPQLMFINPSLDPLAEGKPLVARMLLKNTSNTAVYDLHVWGEMGLLDASFKSPLKYNPNHEDAKAAFSAAVMPPGIGAQIILVAPREIGFLNMTKEGIEAINNGENRIAVFGKGKYRDAAGNLYTLSYCFLYHPDARSLANCPTYIEPVKDDPNAN